MRRFFFALLAPLAACASAEKETHDDYLLNALPGAEGFEPFVRFGRGPLEIRAEAWLESGIPVFDLQLYNRSSARITITTAGIRMLSEGRIGQDSVHLLDENEERMMQVILLGYERRKTKVRPASSDLWPPGPVILEVRGIRDDRGEGGLDFDLRAVPKEKSEPEIKTVEK